MGIQMQGKIYGRRMRTARMSKVIRGNKKEKDSNKSKFKAFISSTPFSLFMSILTIYTIFAIDIDKGFFSKESSIYFSAVHLVSMGIFTIEIIIMSQTQPDYLFHFYFWIDVFSTLTMILEVIWIEDLMNSVENIQVAISFARVSKASRFSKIGARSTKIMKLIRLIKLIKFIRKQDHEEENSEIANETQNQEEPEIRQSYVKFTANDQDMKERNEPLKYDNKRNNFEEDENDDHSVAQFFKLEKIIRHNVNMEKQLEIEAKWNEVNMDSDDNAENEDEKEGNTKVGETLKNEIQKNIVLMVMGVIIVVPILSADTWYNKSAEVTYLTEGYINIGMELNDTAQRQTWINIFVQEATKLTDPLIFMQANEYKFPQNFPSMVNDSQTKYEDLRESEKSAAPSEKYNLIYSKKEATKLISWINMCRSVFITLLLVFASIFFIKDLELYALGPLEKMSVTLEHIEKNPFGWGNDEDEEEVAEQNCQFELQTMILEKLIIKMANLVAVGIGEAPSKLISKEFAQEDIEQIQTQEIKGCFMSIRIAHLDEIHQNLAQQQVKYINVLSQLIHEAVIENGGFIFEQADYTFLACWKTGIAKKQNSITQSNKLLIDDKKLADQCFFALMKLEEKIGLSPLIKKYSYLNKIISKFEKLKTHVGISYGTASCGGVGSDFKLTMKAIGKDVLVAKRMSKLAEEYGVTNIYTQQFYRKSEFCKSYSRKIGVITFSDEIKRSIMEIFKGEFQLVGNKKQRESKRFLFGGEQKPSQNAVEIKRYMKKALKTRSQVIEKIQNAKIEQLNIWRASNVPVKKFSVYEDWADNWREGLQFYEEKQWNHARVSFQICNDLYPDSDDPICDQYLRIIYEHKDEAPKSWVVQKQLSLFE